MQGYCHIFSEDYFEADADRSPCLHGNHQGVKVEHFDVSNVIYHKCLHSAVSYTLSGENVSVMLELSLLYDNSYVILSSDRPFV